MKNALVLVFFSLVIGCISAAKIDWDAINGDPLTSNRPAPPKRPAPPARPSPPIEEEFLPPNLNEVNGWPAEDDIKVNIHVVGDNKAPPNIGPTEVRPFEPRPTPPAMEQPMGPPGPGHQHPSGPQEPKPVHDHNKPKPPHHFEVQVNEPISSHPSKPILIDVKPLDVVDGFVVPTPKYPAHSRPQIELFYEA